MRAVLVVLLTLLAASLSAIDLPPAVRDAVQLELDGRLADALERYRAALTTENILAQDETLSRPLTVRVLSKAANLSVDLGLGEEAWDLAGRLLAAKNQPAAEAGTLVRMRLLRLQGRSAEALTLFDSYARDWPQGAGQGLLYELWRARSAAKPGTAEAQLAKTAGPASWILAGTASWLPGPGEMLGLTVLEAVRLQVGAFKDWGNALTLLDMLREKGWSPFTETKTSTAGEKLHVVYIVSRQAAADKARLVAQGLMP